MKRDRDQFVVGVRGCAGEDITRAFVTRYDDEEIVWELAADQSSRRRAVEVTLFVPAVDGYAVTVRGERPRTGLLDVSVNDDFGAVFPADMPNGTVAYPGSDDLTTIAEYDALPDSTFC